MVRTPIRRKTLDRSQSISSDEMRPSATKRSTVERGTGRYHSRKIWTGVFERGSRSSEGKAAIM